MKQTFRSLCSLKAKPGKVSKLSLDCMSIKEAKSNKDQLIRIKSKETQNMHLNYPMINPLTRNVPCQTCLNPQQEEDSKMNDSLFYDYLDTVDLTSSNSHPRSLPANVNHNLMSRYNTELLDSQISLTKRSHYSIKSNKSPLSLSNELLQRAINPEISYYNNNPLPLRQSNKGTNERSSTFLSSNRLRMPQKKYLTNIYCNNMKLLQIKQLFKEAIYIDNRIIYQHKLYY